MKKLKKLETILGENIWEYETHDYAGPMYSFPLSGFSVSCVAMHHYLQEGLSDHVAKDWPESFFEEIKAEEKVYRIKLKDMHIALMMTDYKFTQSGIVFIFNDEEWCYPSSLLPSFGDYIKVRKDENGDLVEIETGVIIHTLLIESVASSQTTPVSKEPLTILDLLRMI